MSAARDQFDRSIDAWNADDLDGYLALYADDVQLHGYAPEPLGKEAVRGFYEAVVAAFDRPRIDVHEQIWSGEDTLTARATMTGRHVGEFLGVPATGVDIALPSITLLRFRDGRCHERHASADMLGLLVQLGAIPAPA